MNLENLICNFNFCFKKFDCTLTYAKHLFNYHYLPINIMYLTFESQNEFLKWKKDEEEINDCFFIANSKKRLLNCHRNLYIKNLKNVANEDTLKMKTICPAQIAYDIKDGKYCVIYIRSHIENCLKLKKLVFSKTTKELILNLHQKGLPASLILLKIIKENINYIESLVTPKYINQVINDYQLNQHSHLGLLD